MEWNDLSILPYDFQIKTLTDKRYGPNKLGPDYLIQDWGLTYDQLEPYFDKFEKTAGISGDDKNKFSGKRSNPYPTPPMKKRLCLHNSKKRNKPEANTLYGSIS